MEALHIVGAGGIGCAVGYALRHAGLRVVFVEKDAAKIQDGIRRGIQVDEHPRLRAEFVHCDDWRPVAGSWVLLCTKCYDNASVLNRLTAPVRLLPIQNGYDTALEAFGHDFEGIASFVAQTEPGRAATRITRSGDLHLGRKSPGGSPDSELQELAATLKASRLFRVQVVPAIEPFKNTKLMYNAAISPLAAASGIDNGKLLSLPTARQVFFAMIQENHRILTAAKKPLGKIGPFHPATVAWILRHRWFAARMAKVFEPALRGTYCSMAGEIQKGRTELDNYNGHLLHLAKLSGSPAPMNQAIVNLVTRMTAERQSPDPRVLEELAAIGQFEQASPVAC